MPSDEDPPYFRLVEGTLSIDRLQQVQVRFVATDERPRKSHITVISGANGTSKSRMLASIVDNIRGRARTDGLEKKGERSSDGQGGLHWLGLTSQGSVPQTAQFDLDGPLPSRTLAISTIVMDKFPYTTRQTDNKDEHFYYYLGSRQASNAVMIGAMGRAMVDALVNMLPIPERFTTFLEWTQLVFGEGCEIALEFEKLSRKQIERYLEEGNREEFIRKRTELRRGRVSRSEIDDESVAQITRSATQLFEFLRNFGEEVVVPNERGFQDSGPVIRLPLVNQSLAYDLNDAWNSLSDLSRAGFSASPRALLKLKDNWIDFNSLSSGEQNVLSTGAKLISYATPASLIVMDEPEVSLNVAWQQKYVELVLRSLEHAPGSHVLIATHSPHIVANLPHGMATVIVVSKTEQGLDFETQPAEFEGWGSESVLYEVLGIPSASSFLFNREIADVLHHIQNGGRDTQKLDAFIDKAGLIQTAGVEPLEELLAAIKEYREKLS